MNIYDISTLSLNYELSPDDAIVESPSLVTPILLKKKSPWFNRISEEQERQKNQAREPGDATTSNDETAIPTTAPLDANSPDDDDIQIIQIINKNSATNGDKRTGPLTGTPVCPKNKIPEDYIRLTTLASLTKTSSTIDSKPILAIDDYFESSVGKFLIDIGLSRVLEKVLESEHRSLSKKAKANSNQWEKFETSLQDVSSKLEDSRKLNEIYKAEFKYRCPHCPFKSDLAIVMSGHLEKPHQDKKKLYLCSWCDYKIRDPNLIIHHCYAEHKQKCYIEKPSANHQCIYCPFETNSKKKLNSHQIICEQNFPITTFLSPLGENYDYPAITPKFIFKQDISTYEKTLNAIRLASYNPNIFKVPGSHQSANGYQPVFVVPGRSLQTTGRNSLLASNQMSVSSDFVANKNSREKTTANTKDNSSRLMALLAERNVTNPRFGLLQYPRNLSTSFTNGRLATETVPSVLMRHPEPQAKKARFDASDSLIRDLNQTGSPTTSISNPKSATFVICEICDWYIKDLSQLKSHMQLYHKVKLHQRTLESRPPLNCQKCQWRFFTDQGLERHLLGAHGLVTSNMQELVDEENDSGRCTVCGRAFTSKLVAHMKEVHKSKLKPAHLSYKCTVCAATFNLYRLFENHVYTVHSDSVRRVNKII